MTKSEHQSARPEDSSWNQSAESMVREEPQAKRVYDLQERTARFGEAVKDPVTHQLISKRTSKDPHSRCFRHSSFVIPSSFVIRHFDHAC